MKNAMEYKGYTGIVEFSAEDEVFFGKIAGINDLITFEADSVKKLQKSFHEAVDDYIETCEHQGKAPERAYKGSFNVRIDPEIHRKAAFKAQSLHISLNQLVENAIAKDLELSASYPSLPGHDIRKAYAAEKGITYNTTKGKSRASKGGRASKK